MVDVGVPNKHNIKIDRKGNEHPEYMAGDLVVVVTVKPHPFITRVNNDLLITQKVGLIEALTGFSFNIKHINDQDITISTAQGQIIQHKQEMRVKELGMHHFKNQYSNGDLVVTFEVQMPTQLSASQIEVLKTALPKGLLPQVVQTKNQYTLEKLDQTQQKKREQQKEQK